MLGRLSEVSLDSDWMEGGGGEGGRWRGWSDDGEEAKEHEKGEGWR